ncbi:class II glutamine amidotransferase [Vibrio genomosp. F10]|uniref:Class II glutamine amidotransferase n=1 Tax=Vibrio genomosp. F10 TaxID=723171 RepID=A0A1B9R0L2_9VIBR|nr:class II glutamine amidotransferase [Vibrio genomosp. F10]OCH77372.1 class II glutamine amidotransferase [Vibrio genomosp. F10]
MCRWLAYQGVPRYIDELVYEPVHSLINQSMDAQKAVTRVNADGFGIGWYNERRSPGQFHEVLPAWSDENLRSLAHHIRSHRFMAHIRSSTGAQVSRANCHPFIIDNWMFMHNGQIGDFESVKFELERQLDKEWYLKKKGSTDSELIFLLALANGLETDPISSLQKTIQMISNTLKAHRISEPFKASICVSDGNAFWVIRYSSDNKPPTVFISQSTDAIILASEPLDKERLWKSIPPQTITFINKQSVETYPILF